jgi:hypothetical protein
MALVTKLFQRLNNYTQQPDVSSYDMYDNDYIKCMKSYNNIVYIGGSFTKIINNLDNIIVNNVFIYNSLNNRITKMQGGLNNVVNQICVDTLGNAYIVGEFTKVYDSSYNEIYDNSGNSIKYLVKWDYINSTFDYVLNNGYFNNFSGSILSCDIFNDKYLYLGSSGFNNINIDNQTRYVYLDDNGYLYPPNPTLSNLIMIYLDDDKDKVKKVNISQTITTSVNKIRVINNNQSIYISSESDISGGFYLLNIVPNDLSHNTTAEFIFNGYLNFYLSNLINTNSNNSITCNATTHYNFSNNLIDRNISIDASSNLYKLTNTTYDISGVVDYSGVSQIYINGDLDTNSYFSISQSYKDISYNAINFNTTLYLDISGNLSVDPNGSGTLGNNYTNFIFGVNNDGYITMQFIYDYILGPISFYGNMNIDVSGSVDTSNNIINVNINNINKSMSVLYYSNTIYSTQQVKSFYVDVDVSNNYYIGGENFFKINSTSKVITDVDVYDDYIINDIIAVDNLFNTSNRYLYLIGYFKSSTSINNPYVSIFLYNITLDSFDIYEPYKPLYYNRYNVTSIMNCGIIAPSIFNTNDLLSGGMYMSYYEFKKYYSMINYLQVNNIILANAAINLIFNLINSNITNDTFSTQIGYIFKSYLSIIKFNN